MKVQDEAYLKMEIKQWKTFYLHVTKLSFMKSPSTMLLYPSIYARYVFAFLVLYSNLIDSILVMLFDTLCYNSMYYRGTDE